METIRKAKDSSIKMVLDEPEMFVEFLRDFIPIDILKDIKAEDIEDVTSRFLTSVSEQKDGDTVKRINLKNNQPLFVIAIVEHESGVNYRASFKMLLYIALILDGYEKEVIRDESQKMKPTRKDFKYPPILPIVFYDGKKNWTAETNFLYKTEMHEIFEKYIPKFEYELVNLKEHSVEDLTKYGNLLSLFMILDKIKTPDSLGKVLSSLPQDYIEKLKLNVPDHLKKLLADVTRLLLTKINTPQEEIDELTERIYERGVSEMFGIENYDVQETRRIARSEGIAEGEARGEARGKAIGEAKGKASGISSVLTIIKGLQKNTPLAQLAKEAGLPLGEVERIQQELVHVT